MHIFKTNVTNRATNPASNQADYFGHKLHIDQMRRDTQHPCSSWIHMIFHNRSGVVWNDDKCSVASNSYPSHMHASKCYCTHCTTHYGTRYTH